jgi:hypothetical protein
VPEAETILLLPGGGLMIVGGTISLALLSYYVARAFLAAGAGEEARELAGSVIFRVSALHGLILALVFAEELVNLNSVEETASHEAATVADVFYDLQRYDEEATRPIRAELAAYVFAVSGEEWETLATHGQLSENAWARWIGAYEAILELEPQGIVQRELKAILLNDIREVSELRMARENAAGTGVNALFMAAAVLGVVLTSMSFFTFPPNRTNVLLLSVFGAYTGVVIYFIVAFADPYLRPGSVEPLAFQRLLVGEVKELAEVPTR